MRELTMLWTHADRLGYGRLGIKLAAAVRALGVDIYERQGVEGDQHPERDSREKKTHALCTISYPSHLRGWWDGQHKTAFTMFESTRLPEAFTETLHEYDLVLVPSVQNVELFSRFHPNVQLCMLGVDPAEWSYMPRSAPGVYFDFLVGGSGPRKGIDLAVDAFLKGFGGREGIITDGPIPRLTVKAPKAQDIPVHDRIVQLNGFLSPEAERNLYARSHCYVQPSRGEGFGLQPLQAIAQGLPTVLTNAHGHEPFADLGWGVAADMVKVPYGYFSIGEAGEWWEPRLDDLVDRMRYVYDNYDAACGVAATSAVTVAARFTWAHTAERFVGCLGDVLTVPYGGSGGWETTTARMFPVRVLRRHVAEMQDGMRIWEPGVDYCETADVQRILMDSGVLDPAVLVGNEPGMVTADVERYSARHAYCPTCQQRLNSGVTRADELEAELCRS